MREELEAVWAGFANPPDEARPRAWWHWMDGNVDPEGIRLDLEWLHDVGVRGSRCSTAAWAPRWSF
jgi:alpha-L-rhamnosidase